MSSRLSTIFVDVDALPMVFICSWNLENSTTRSKEWYCVTFTSKIVALILACLFVSPYFNYTYNCPVMVWKFQESFDVEVLKRNDTSLPPVWIKLLDTYFADLRRQKRGYKMQWSKTTQQFYFFIGGRNLEKIYLNYNAFTLDLSGK